jgi:hypothetical protein
MILAKPSIRSGGKKEAFARAGASKIVNKTGIKMVFFMGLLEKSCNE